MPLQMFPKKSIVCVMFNYLCEKGCCHSRACVANLWSTFKAQLILPGLPSFRCGAFARQATAQQNLKPRNRQFDPQPIPSMQQENRDFSGYSRQTSRDSYRTNDSRQTSKALRVRKPGYWTSMLRVSPWRILLSGCAAFLVARVVRVETRLDPGMERNM